MSKILIIPDIHGSKYWKKNFLKNVDKVDKVVFLGDYVDSFDKKEKGENAALNFEDLIKTTDPYKENVFLLAGNHDVAYIYQYHGDPHVSGHQYEMDKRYNDMFIQNENRLQIAVKIDNWVFSHAGFSKTWFENTKIGYDIIFQRENIELPNDPVDFVNWMWRDDKDIRMLNFSDYCWNPTGDSQTSPCTWIRPRSLLLDMYYPNQIVGHTEVKTDKPLWIKNKEENLIIVDSPDHDKYLILNTENLKETEQNCQIEIL